MKRKCAIILMLAFVVMIGLSSCGNDESNATIVASSISEDFELRLYVNSATHYTTDAIEIWATIQYTGDEDGVKALWPGNPAPIFLISDGENFNIGGERFAITASSFLERGVVYRFDYVKSASWSANAPDAHFWRNFSAEPELFLPAGVYTISVIGPSGEFLGDNILPARADLTITVLEP